MLGDGARCVHVAKPTRLVVDENENHVCALDEDGYAKCAYLPGRRPKTAPVDETFTQLAGGYVNTCGLRANGTVRCWSIADHTADLPSSPAGVAFTQIDVGGYDEFVCGVRTGGTILCWDAAGKTFEPLAGTFVQVTGLLTLNDDPGRHICGLRADGSVACAGSTPPAGASFAKLNEVGDDFCGIDQNGAVTCWGRHTWGNHTPQGDGWAQVAGHCALSTEGTVSCSSYWREEYDSLEGNDYVQLAIEPNVPYMCGLHADGTTTCKGTPSPPPNERFVRLITGGAGFSHLCGLRADGKAVCWRGSERGHTNVPSDVRFTQLMTGHCGLSEAGKAICWDYTGATEMPGGPYVQLAYSAPSGLMGLTPEGSLESLTELAATPLYTPAPLVHVSSYYDLNCGLTTVTAKPVCWIAPDYGHTLSFSPPDEPFAQLVTAWGQTLCGLRDDGSYHCGGTEGTDTQGDFISLAAGKGRVCALSRDGTTPCASGMSALADVKLTELALPYYYSYASSPVCGIADDGIVRCWYEAGSDHAQVKSVTLFDP